MRKRSDNGKNAPASAANSAGVSTPVNTTETISALLDDQADDLALPRLLKAAASDKEVPGLWARYHLVHSLLRGCQVLARPSLARRVAAAVATLPLPSAQTTQQTQAAQQAQQAQQQTRSTGQAQEGQAVAASAAVPGWAPWQANLGRVAIAASVAVAVFFGLQSGLQPSEEMPLASDSDGGYTVADGARVADARTDAKTEAQADAQEVASNVRIYLQRIYGDAEVEPVHIEQLADSPLYRLVNELRAEPETP